MIVRNLQRLMPCRVTQTLQFSSLIGSDCQPVADHPVGDSGYANDNVDLREQLHGIYQSKNEQVTERILLS